MFLETVTAPRDEWEHWNERLRMLSDPPRALVAAITWNAGDGQVTSLNLWETPEAVADFFMERVRPILEAEGEAANKPQRHGVPISVYIRNDSHGPIDSRR